MKPENTELIYVRRTKHFPDICKQVSKTELATFCHNFIIQDLAFVFFLISTT